MGTQSDAASVVLSVEFLKNLKIELLSMFPKLTHHRDIRASMVIAALFTIRIERL